MQWRVAEVETKEQTDVIDESEVHADEATEEQSTGDDGGCGFRGYLCGCLRKFLCVMRV